MIKIIKERLEKVLRIPVDSSSHDSIEEGLCVMEAVSYIAGERWADHPKCACPILTAYAIQLNDQFNNKDRQNLKPLISLLVGTRASKEDRKRIQIARKRLILWRNVTVTYPHLIDHMKGCEEYAAKLRTFTNDVNSMKKAARYISEKRKATGKKYFPVAEVNANSYAYSVVDADAYARAKNLRSDIAHIAVETLRLAIEIK